MIDNILEYSCIALDNIETVKEWPYVFIVRDREHGDVLMRELMREAANRGVKMQKIEKGRVVLDGAEYDFVAHYSVERWIHGYDFFTDVIDLS